MAGVVHGFSEHLSLSSPMAQGPSEAAPQGQGGATPHSGGPRACVALPPTHPPAGAEPSALLHLLGLIEGEEQPSTLWSEADEGCVEGTASPSMAATSREQSMCWGHKSWGHECWGHALGCGLGTRALGMQVLGTRMPPFAQLSITGDNLDYY